MAIKGYGKRNIKETGERKKRVEGILFYGTGVLSFFRGI